MATREQIYARQLQELGVYDPAFDPEIKTLAQLERRKTRAEKAWSATAPPGGKPSFLDPHYQIIVQLEDKILAHREALGLTPKALRRLRGADVPVSGGSGQTEITARLDRLLERAGEYDLGSVIPFPDMGGGDGRADPRDGGADPDRGGGEDE